MFGKVLEGMDIVYAIGMFFYLRPPRPITLTRRAEVVPKGGNDRPLEDVVIYDSGEVCLGSHKYYYILTDELSCSCLWSLLLTNKDTRYHFALSYSSAAHVLH